MPPITPTPPEPDDPRRGPPRARIERAALDAAHRSLRLAGRGLAAIGRSGGHFLATAAGRAGLDSAGGVAAWLLRLLSLAVLVVVAGNINAEGIRGSLDYAATPLRKIPLLAFLGDWRETYKTDLAVVLAVLLMLVVWVYSEILVFYLRFPPDRFTLERRVNVGFGLGVTGTDALMFFKGVLGGGFLAGTFDSVVSALALTVLYTGAVYIWARVVSHFQHG